MYRGRLAAAPAAAAFAVLLAVPLPAGAQHVNGLGRADPILAEVERLAEAGLVDGPVGQGPWSGREMQRLVRLARARLVMRDSAAQDARAPDAGLARAAEALAALAAILGDSTPPGRASLRIRGLGSEVAHLASPARPVLPFNGLGYIDAAVNPLANHPSGRTLPEGSSLLVWAGATAAVGSRLELVAQARAGLHSGGDEAWRAATERLVAAGRLGNAVVAIGRDHVRWGQGMETSTLFADDAPALDMLRISTDAPVVLPWLLRYAGPLRATLLVADLTGPGHFRGERLAAWKVSILPWQRLELGAMVSSQQGGSGAPAATFGERVADLVPLVDAIFLGDRDLQISNKLAGVDGRLRLSERSGLAVYGELLLDDFDLRRVRSTLVDDGAWIAGIAMPRVAGGPVGMAAEHHHTGLRFYRHGEFRSGVTHGGELLGNPLGPEADAVKLRMTLDRGPLRRLTLDATLDERRANQYTSTGGVTTDDGTLRFVLVERRPAERRARGTFAVAHWLPAQRVHLAVEAGAERVTNFGHVAGSARTNALVRISATKRF